MQSYAKKFGSIKDAENCSALNNAGSVILVGYNRRCSSEPDLYTVVANAAAAIGAETMTVFLGGILPVGVANPMVYLQQGTKLYFVDPAAAIPVYKVATITEDLVVTAVTAATAVSISIEPLTAAITANDVAKTWALLRILGADGFDVNIQAGTESTSTLISGLKGQNTTTSLMMDSNLSMILEPDDPAFWKIIHTAATTGRHFFILTARPGGTYAWGEAQAGNYSRPGQKQSVQKATVAVNMQQDWAAPTMAKYLAANELLLMQDVCRLSGIPLPVIL
jgi:hypothetical protein